MSPYTVIVVLILTILFGLLSLVPFLAGPKDVDSFDPSSTKPRAAH